MKIYFSHGKKGKPNSQKIKSMSKLSISKGFDIESIDYTNTIDPDKRVVHLMKILTKEKGEYVLVGSSMGAYVSLVSSVKLKNKPLGIFLAQIEIVSLKIGPHNE
jgi:predicted esterase YcpF (UPF0227 family)